MCQFTFLTFPMVYRKSELIPSILLISLLALASCNMTNQEYSTDKQYDLAENRIEGMKNELGFSFTLDEETIHLGETIFFTAHFTNRANTPVMLRIPKQSGVLDIDHPNTTLQYSITPLDEAVSLALPLSIYVTPNIFVNPVQAREFEILDPHATKDIKLKIPNIVYLKQGEQWVESVLPLGKYLINITYKNLYIGYKVEKEDKIYFVDKSAWVGQIAAEPVLVTISP